MSSYGAPSHDEKRHHFLWRFYRAVPGLGGMCVFDRSWYGRVLVERVEGFATEQQWRRAYEVIVGFERSLVIEGMHPRQVLAAHQRRGAARPVPAPRERSASSAGSSPRRTGATATRNREYDRAAEEMFARTDHELAPWDVVSAEQKRYARIAVLER